MTVQTGGEAVSARIGAVALPLGVILLVVSTMLHPSREDPMDNPAVFREYAEHEGWVAVHFGQWVAGLLFFAGLVALYYSLTARPGRATLPARLGLAAVVVTAAALTMLQAVDGVALKWAVDTWTAAPADRQDAAFAAAETLRWTEYSLQSYFSILLGLTLILFGLAIAAGSAYPRWTGWLAAASGAAWIVHGLMVPYIGLFESVPRGIASVLMYLWSFIMAFLMWRRAGREAEAAPSAA
ncbi:hypothetical protein ACFQ36_05270 [Arthrobacter sp. GCM10027362]|uniref:hypothetical protein n=1 Tax=Arthrobacter sp. GCM10027362 TaxID=3273379 RepID=UPI00362D57A5